jgi:hypothetical protein
MRKVREREREKVKGKEIKRKPRLYMYCSETVSSFRESMEYKFLNYNLDHGQVLAYF